MGYDSEEEPEIGTGSAITAVPPDHGLPIAGVGEVRVWAYRNGWAGVRERVPIDEVSDLLHQRETLVFIDLNSPHPAALEKLRIECRLHPLAIEDVRQPHQRPKIDEYASFYFVVFYVAAYTPATERVDVHEVDLFVGDRFVVTVHQRKSPLMTAPPCGPHLRSIKPAVRVAAQALGQDRM